MFNVSVFTAFIYQINTALVSKKSLNRDEWLSDGAQNISKNVLKTKNQSVCF